MRDYRHHNIHHAAGYLIIGIRKLLDPKIRPFVIIPVAVNILVFGLLAWWATEKFTVVDQWLTNALPSWLSFLSFLIWPLFVIALLAVTFFTFNLVANFIAAPFNGFLAEKIQVELDPGCVPDADWKDLIQFIPRTIGRECQRLGYYLPKALVLLALSFVPVVNLFTPILWLLLSAWMLSIQYCDYAADNELVSFKEMKTQLAQPYSQSVAFGAMVALLTLIPFINLILMPAAVIGGTHLWVERRGRRIEHR